MPTVLSGPRPIPLTFNRHGHTYTQTSRTNKAAIYRVDDVGWEVIKIRVAQPQKLPGGKMAPLREVYPSDNEFGRYGWYFMKVQEQQMREKFDLLNHGATE